MKRIRFVPFAFAVMSLTLEPAFAQTLFVPSGTSGVGTSSQAGKVGVGTSNPSRPLEVSGTGSVYSKVTSTNSFDAALQFSSAGYDAYIGRLPTSGGGAGTLDFYNSGLWMVINPSGNVGIGTTAPTARLQVNGTVLLGSGATSLTGGFNGEFGNASIGNSGGFRFNKNSATAGQKILSSFHANSGAEFYHEVVSGTSTQFIFIGGSVGIGTVSPSTQLQVAGTVLLGSSASALTSNFNGEFGNPGVGGSGGFRFNRNSATAGHKVLSSLHSNSGAEFYHEIISATSAQFIFSGGNVGIGTTSPTQPLTVNGTIRAKEVIVDTGWSDYVFDENYKLTALSETEAFVRTEKHLPGIPSAKEVAEHGINVGDMQAKLLAKIEELTLHLIAQENELRAQRARIETQVVEIEALKAKRN